MTHWLFEHQEPDHRNMKPAPDYAWRTPDGTIRRVISVMKTMALLKRLERSWMLDYVLPPRKHKPSAEQ